MTIPTLDQIGRYTVLELIRFQQEQAADMEGTIETISEAVSDVYDIIPVTKNFDGDSSGELLATIRTLKDGDMISGRLYYVTDQAYLLISGRVTIDSTTLFIDGPAIYDKAAQTLVKSIVKIKMSNYATSGDTFDCTTDAGSTLYMPVTDNSNNHLTITNYGDE